MRRRRSNIPLLARERGAKVAALARLRRYPGLGERDKDADNSPRGVAAESGAAAFDQSTPGVDQSTLESRLHARVLTPSRLSPGPVVPEPRKEAGSFVSRSCEYTMRIHNGPRSKGTAAPCTLPCRQVRKYGDRGSERSSYKIPPSIHPVVPCV